MKRVVPLFLTALLVCSMACPAFAAESPASLYPVEVLEYTAGDLDELRISKTYELFPAEDPALIPTEDFERSGRLYTLLTVTLDSKSKDMEEIMPMLAATCEAATEDGYTGILTLDTASIQVEASGYGTSTKNVSAKTVPLAFPQAISKI